MKKTLFSLILDQRGPARTSAGYTVVTRSLHARYTRFTRSLHAVYTVVTRGLHGRYTRFTRSLHGRPAHVWTQKIVMWDFAIAI
jgi:hypothetical protein